TGARRTIEFDGDAIISERSTGHVEEVESFIRRGRKAIAKHDVDYAARLESRVANDGELVICVGVCYIESEDGISISHIGSADRAGGIQSAVVDDVALKRAVVRYRATRPNRDRTGVEVWVVIVASIRPGGYQSAIRDGEHSCAVDANIDVPRAAPLGAGARYRDRAGAPVASHAPRAVINLCS